MKQYLEMLNHVLEHGEERKDRTGVGTKSVFGYQTRFDLREGFPLLTTKKIFFKSVVYELLWFLKGKTNIYEGLKPHTKIWDDWADETGELGPIYGYQWRAWPKYSKNEEGTYDRHHVDQIQQVIHDIKHNPCSRRLIVSAWNVADLDEMALPPCHSFFQFYVCDGYLDCQLYQRSADLAIGVPFNIASYALLLMIIAQECDLKPRHFVHSFGDLHLYSNHLEGVQAQLKREPKTLPTVSIAKKAFDALEYEDIELKNYVFEPFIPFEIAV